MIRMGRNSRTEPSETPEYQPQPVADTYRYQTNTVSQPTAVTESDSMARDIKEGRLSGFVGHGTTLTGETDFHAMLRVDGHLIGSVSSETGTLIVGANGQVDANIMVAAAMINGAVNGDIIASEKLHLGRTARVLGNIQSPRLVIEEGAMLEGSCSMMKARETQEEAAAAAQARQYEQSTPTYSAADDNEEKEMSSIYSTADDDETVDAVSA